MWHVALKEGTTELQDVIIAAVPIEELELLSALLQTDRLKGRSFETDQGNFFMMYDGNTVRPLYVWSEWLMPEDTDAEYVPPEQFIVMGRRQP